MLLIAKILFLFLGIAYGFIWFAKFCRGQKIPMLTTFLAAGGAAGFVALQWLI